MREGEGYNGWANYPTWAVGLYLDGSYDGPYTYHATIETVREALVGDHPESEYWTVEQSQRYGVADALKDFVEQNTDPCGYGNGGARELHPLVSDLLGASLSSVDWHELADAWIENVSEQVV